MTDSNPASFTLKPPVRSASRRSMFIVGLLAGGIASGGAGFAIAATGPGHFGSGQGPRLEFVQRFVLGALDSVGATTAQESRIHDIVAATFAEMGRGPEERDAVHQQALALLRAPSIDRAAVEKLRADQVSNFDTMSKKMVDAVLEAADQLTPDQRAKLADRAETLSQRGLSGRPWGGSMDEGHHPFMQGEHGPDQGRDYGPDSAPDKG